MISPEKMQILTAAILGLNEIPLQFKDLMQESHLSRLFQVDQ